MNQQAFSGGLAPPFLPLSLPSGVAPPAGHPAIAGAPHVPFAPAVPNNTQSTVVNNGSKEDQSDQDQVRGGADQGTKTKYGLIELVRLAQWEGEGRRGGEREGGREGGEGEKRREGREREEGERRERGGRERVRGRERDIRWIGSTLIGN